MSLNWKHRYVAPTSSLWQGRTDETTKSRLFGHVHCLNLLNDPIPKITGHAFGFLGFASDEGVRRNQGRLGAAQGPQSLRQALAKHPLHLTEPCHFFDFGDITCLDHHLEDAQLALGQVITKLHHHQIKPIVLGGGHEVSFGHYQGIASAFKDSNCGIINFDAHFDLRPLLKDNKGSSGTPFFQIATQQHHEKKNFHYLCLGIQKQANTSDLFQTAHDLNVHYITAEQIHQQSETLCRQAIDRLITQTDHLYLTICLDVFGAPFAPGVSAPQVQGLTPWQVNSLMQYVISSGHVVGFDIAELCPPLDQHGTTAALGASLISNYIHA